MGTTSQLLSDTLQQLHEGYSFISNHNCLLNTNSQVYWCNEWTNLPKVWNWNERVQNIST